MPDTGSSLGAAWRDPASFASTLLVAFLDRFGPGAVYGSKEESSWDPETMAEEVRAEWGEVPAANVDRLLAACAVVTTDLFTSDLRAFIDLCNVLSGAPFDPRIWDPADPLECAWGLTEALLLDPQEGDDPLHPEIVLYIKRACREYGLLKPPDVLGVAGVDPALLARWDGDPALGPLVRQASREREGEIEQAVRGRLRDLLDQLEKLALETGDTKDLVGRVRADLQRKG